MELVSAVYILHSKISTDPGLLKIWHSHRFVAACGYTDLFHLLYGVFSSICQEFSRNTSTKTYLRNLEWPRNPEGTKQPFEDIWSVLHVLSPLFPRNKPLFSRNKHFVFLS